MIDSHCHLAGPEFAVDLPDVVARAQAAGVSSALVIIEASDVEERARAAAVSAGWLGARFAVGVHPHCAKAFAEDPAEVDAHVQAVLAELPAVCVGEIGLDYHYDLSPRDTQRLVFAAQIRAARRLGLPIAIHTREAEDDTFDILRQERADEVGGVFHCFTGDRRMARRALDIGFHISLSGIVTFPKATELHLVAREVPLDRLLIETDSPFLAPVPHRGTRNEPSRVALVGAAIAALRGLPATEVAGATAANFERLFGRRLTSTPGGN